MAEEGNEFNAVAEREQRQHQAQKLELSFDLIKELKEMIEGLTKEVRAVREDLRNLDKLRALRKKDEPASKGKE